MKKINALLTLTLSSCVMASVHANCCYPRYMPTHGGWYAEVEPFHVTANESLLTRISYAFTFRTVTTATTEVTDSQFQKFSPDNTWGFRAAVGYDFPSCNPCSNYGFSLEYTQFDTDQKRNILPFINSSGLEELTIASPISAFFVALDNTASAFTYSRASAKLEADYDAADLLVHKNIVLPHCGNLQLFTGVRYVYLKENLAANYFRPLTPGVSELNEHIEFDNKFDGAGPHLGAKVFYPVVWGFGITGELAGDAIFGESESDYVDHLEETVPAGDFVTNSRLVDHAHRAANVIPGVSGKVGLAFKATFCNCSYLAIEAGYRGNKYFGIADDTALLEAIGASSAVRATGGLGIDYTNKDANFQDFSFTGVYLTVSFHA